MPNIHAIRAVTTGIRAEKMLDFATPRFLIVLTQRVNARLEHNIARHIRGYQTSGEKYLAASNPGVPFHKKSGKRYTEPMRN